MASIFPKKFILASQSPRRKQMLLDMGVSFEIVVPDIPEDLLDGESPERHTSRLAYGKAMKIAAGSPDALVLGVDTAVVIDDAILGKPSDESDAQRMLGMLAGQTHTVVTSFALLFPNAGVEIVRSVASRVFIRALNAEQIRRYVQTGEPMDKAGAYAIQGVGAGLVKRVEGSYTCVVGLPLAELIEEIEGLFGPDWLFEKR